MEASAPPMECGSVGFGMKCTIKWNTRSVILGTDAWYLVRSRGSEQLLSWAYELSRYLANCLGELYEVGKMKYNLLGAFKSGDRGSTSKGEKRSAFV